MSASTQVVFDVTLTTINCGECGGTYAINERYRQQKYQEGKGWHCPYCRCGWGYFNNGENAKLKKELELERQRKERALADANEQRRAKIDAQNRERAQKGAKTRLKNRISKGVCPCCTRSFENLQRHMKSQHPEFTQELQQ